jgi:CRP-like cAMP-binding protein
MTDENNDIILQVGDVLFDTDKPLDTAYFILEGSVELQLVLGDKKISLNIGANNFVGDAAVAVSQKNNGASPSYQGKAIATEPVRAVLIPVQDIQREIESCSPLLKAWFASFTSRVLTVIESLSHK